MKECKHRCGMIHCLSPRDKGLPSKVINTSQTEIENDSEIDLSRVALHCLAAHSRPMQAECSHFEEKED